MYWLLESMFQQKIREDIDKLVESLSVITGNPQTDQLFPYVGRKDRRKALVTVKVLTNNDGLVVEPFAGSGSFAYAIWQAGRQCAANEWEPYACTMANAPWCLPMENKVTEAIEEVTKKVESWFNDLYKIKCNCGHQHVLDTQFFDREPLRYKNITKHERLGKNGETITYRQSYKCPKCKRTEKHFDDIDAKNMIQLETQTIPAKYHELFNSPLIENSRINLSKGFLTYKKLFPKRSILALCKLSDAIYGIKCDKKTRTFLYNAFLSIIPQAKYKDYRSKSQDLHCPPVQLREVNIWYRFLDQVEKRYAGLKQYGFANQPSTVISCKDFRDFMSAITAGSAELVLTDPPWTDGNAYFEKAQLYHPWMGYNLSNDKARLLKEFVVTDAPSRKRDHGIEKWWEDMEEFIRYSHRVLKPLGYLALFFRPIPAARWLSNLNRLKLIARRSGLEPLLSIDVCSSDPSMRIQQSASYVFSQDIIFVFVKVPNSARRYYVKETDVDQLVFQAAERVQENVRGPFNVREWRNELSELFREHGTENLNAPKYENRLYELMLRYCDEISLGLYLPKANTPFSGQLFDIPAIERLFTYAPLVIKELLKNTDRFTYDRFLLRLSEYVENGTRELINQIEHIDIRSAIEPYAMPMDGGRWFKKRPLPKLPHGLRNVLELEPYDFETFVAKLLEAQGFTSVGLVGRSGDRGVDVIATDPKGVMTIIQCKRYFRHKVSATPVQRLHSFGITRGAQRRMLVTTSGFTPQAKEEAKHTNTELINGRMLEALIAKYLPDFATKID
jgi:restriction system protein